MLKHLSETSLKRLFDHFSCSSWVDSRCLHVVHLFLGTDSWSNCPALLQQRMDWCTKNRQLKLVSVRWKRLTFVFIILFIFSIKRSIQGNHDFKGFEETITNNEDYKQFWADKIKTIAEKLKKIK